MTKAYSDNRGIPTHVAQTKGYWKTSMLEQLHEHLFSAVFPKRSKKWFARKAKQYSERGQDEPIVLANGKIIFGRNNIAICKLADLQPRVLDLGRQSENDVKRCVTAINAFSRNVSRRQKRIAAESLHLRSGGLITYDEATKICGVSICELAVVLAVIGIDRPVVH